MLCGSDSHSFERQALEQWLVANSQIHPITRELLPLGAGSVVPNVTLRSLLQQLHPSWISMGRTSHMSVLVLGLRTRGIDNRVTFPNQVS